MLIDKIELGCKDMRGQIIEYIYSKVDKTFAIYKADNKIWLHYADEGKKSADGQELGEVQRNMQASLIALRGQIDGCLRKLETALHPVDDRDRSEIDFYNTRIAGALFNALQGFPAQAELELTDIHSEILERLRSLGRLDFAWSTIAVSIVVLFVLVFLLFLAAQVESVITGSPIFTRDHALVNQSLSFVLENDLWVAALFGTLGAWFSIALWLRTSNVQVSTNRLDNFVDPALRIIVAIIAAVVLFSMVRIGLFNVTIGTTPLGWKDVDRETWKYIDIAIILAFVAGFSERLVGDFLSGSTLGAASAGSPKAISQANRDGTETNPLGRVGGRGTLPLRSASPEPKTEILDDDDFDVSDHPLPDAATLAAEATPDEDLPPSTGGVATEDTNRWGPQ